MRIKLNIDDTVFPVGRDQYSKTETCGLCKGDGKVKISGSERSLTCPDCVGVGEIQVVKFTPWKVYDKTKIGEIASTQDRHGAETFYRLDSSGYFEVSKRWTEADLFLSKKDAERECDKRNNPHSVRSEGL